MSVWAAERDSGSSSDEARRRLLKARLNRVGDSVPSVSMGSPPGVHSWSLTGLRGALLVVAGLGLFLRPFGGSAFNGALLHSSDCGASR